MGALSSEQLAELAGRHQAARARAEAIGQPTLEHPDMTIDDAYAVQRAWSHRGGRYLVAVRSTRIRC